MKTLAPANSLMTLRNEMDRLFDRIWDGDANKVSAQGDWLPALDLRETKEGFFVMLDVPGIEPRDIHVTLREGLLIIRGERKNEIEEKEETFYRTERQYGIFSRAVRLPSAVDGSKVAASFKNGVLTVMVPKSAESKDRDIPVHVS
ncbi:MAG TPA: Hsp20/alpha crystallin family protein [Candidatus Saccharimonadaceae bacterium]|jgi:HSP20 family protein|nr:Hsp20/alpha crystallin family protein [Candidatus Saccharimonadaceae bacterium]